MPKSPTRHRSAASSTPSAATRPSARGEPAAFRHPWAADLLELGDGTNPTRADCAKPAAIPPAPVAKVP